MKQNIQPLLKRTGMLILCVWFVLGLEAWAQPLGEEGLENLNEALNVNAQGWSVQQTRSSLGSNILWPEESADFTFFIKPQLPFKGTITLEVISYGVRTRAGQPAHRVVYRKEGPSTQQTVEAEFSSEGGCVTFHPEIGEGFGGYALVMELEGRGRALAASLVRVVEPDTLPPAASLNTFTHLEKLGFSTAALALDPLQSRTPQGVRLARSEEEVAISMGLLRALGQEETQGIYRESVFTKKYSAIGDQEFELWQPWPAAAAAAAVQKWIGTLSFQGMLFKKGLPWVFVFDRNAGSQKRVISHLEEGALLITGDLKETYLPETIPWRSVQLNAGASMVIENPNNEFICYDFYGNPLESMGGEIAIPLNSSGYFVKTTGKRGSFKRLLKAAARADILNVEPVEIAVSDFLGPVTQEGTVLKVRLSNVLNRPIEGTLHALVPGVVLANELRELKLKPFQTKEVNFEIEETLSQKRDANNYPLIIAWENEEGTVKHAETLHVNAIEPFSPKLDGDLTEWRNRLPQAASLPISSEENWTPYLPFDDWPSVAERDTVTGWLAWDNECLYFALRTPAQEGPCQVEIALRANPEKKKNQSSGGNGIFAEAFAPCTNDYELALESGEDAKIIYLSALDLQKVNQKVGGRSVLVNQGRMWECAIDWNEIPEIRASLLKGKPIAFNYRVQSEKRAWELARERSVSYNCFQEGEVFHWANQIIFQIQKQEESIQQ